MQVAGTTIRIKWDYYLIVTDGTHIFEANLDNCRSKLELSTLLGTTLESPDGVLFRIHGIRTVNYNSENPETEFYIDLIPLERPF